MDWLSGLPPEIWTLVAEEIRSPQTLMACSQVCHGFYDLFIPYLHRQHSLRLSRKAGEDWLDWPLPNGFAHVKDFTVLWQDLEDDGVEYEVGMNNAYAEFVARLLSMMPNLRSFRWFDCSWEPEFNVALILSQEPLHTALMGHPTLTSLSIQFASQGIVEEALGLHCWMLLVGFKNLTSLELYHFYDRVPNAAGSIAGLLSNNQGIRKLGLAMGCETDAGGIPEILVAPPERDFLERLCKEYSHIRGVAPLHLDTLRLGHGLFLRASESSDTGNYLQRLIKTESLKTIHVFNGLFVSEDDEEPEELKTDWSLFGSCSSLRQLSASRLTADLRVWLGDGGKTVQEFIVTDHYGMYDTRLYRFDNLRLPQLSMLFVLEFTVQKRVQGGLSSAHVLIDRGPQGSSTSEMESNSEAESDLATDSGGEEETDPGIQPIPTAESQAGVDSESEQDSDENSDWENDTESSVRSDIFAHDERFFAAHSHQDESSTVTILDHLHDGGSKLTRLALSLNVDDWDSFATHLPNLKQLTQLRVDSKSAHGGRNITSASKMFPGIGRPIEISKRYAQLARYMCSSLQFIRVERWAWQVMIPPGSLEGLRDIWNVIELRRLEYQEMQAIELFSLDNFVNQCGLLGPEDEYEYE